MIPNAQAYAKCHKAQKALQELSDEQMKIRSTESPLGLRPANLQQLEEKADLKLAQDLLGFDHSPITSSDTESHPSPLVGLCSNPVFTPKTMQDFDRLREILVPIISQNCQRDDYLAFIRDLTNQLVADLPIKEIRRIGSSLVSLSDEKSKSFGGSERRPQF